MPVGTYFASSPLYCHFINVLFCGNPHPLPNYPGEADWPQASFGGQVRVLPMPSLYFMAGLYSVDTAFGTGGGGISGWAWADPHKSGVSIPLEAGWVPVFGRNKLVGHYKIGFDHDTHKYADITSAGASHDRDMQYILVDQMLARQGPGPADGLIVFGGYVHADPNVSPLSQHAFGGIITTAAMFGRPKDSINASFQWVEMSSAYTRALEAAAVGANPFPLTLNGFGPAYGPQNTEEVAELNYNVAVYRGVSVTPDFQYIIRPGATTRIPDAAVLGFRTNILF
jgi:porin